MKYGFLVKNYSSMQTDKGKPYKTEYVELDTNKPKDREYYGIREGQSLNTVKNKYKQFWGGDVAIINKVEYKNHRPVAVKQIRKPVQQQSFGFGFSNNKSSSVFSTKGNLPRLFR